MRNTEKFLLALLIFLGVFYRLSSLDRKVFWYDEAYTSLELSGYTPEEAAKDILTGRPVNGAALEKYQHAAWQSPKTIADTVRQLARTEPQLTPLYFITARFWVASLGNSVRTIRLLSVLFALSLLPLAYWLCRELFPSPRVAWMCVALISVSPFHLLYAQEARPYSMWAAATLLSSALLLRALRLQSRFSWALYSLSVVLSLYTYLFSLLVTAGHGAAVALRERFRLTRTARSFLVSVAAAVILFLPWPYRGQPSGAGNDSLSLVRYATKWIRSIAIFFVDFDFSDSTDRGFLIPYAGAAAVLVVLAAYSIWFLYRNAPRREALFVITLIASTAVLISALDLATGSSRALVTRYLYPSFLGMQIAVAYLLAVKTGAEGGRGASAWRAGTAIILGMGLASCVTIDRAETWWNKAPENYVQSASRLINAAQDPLIVSDDWFIKVLSLEHKLTTAARFQLTVEPVAPVIPAGEGQVFAFRPSRHLKSELENRYDFQLVDSAAELWRLHEKQFRAQLAPVTR